MRRPWQIWLVFGLGVTVMFAAMGYVTAEVLELDRAEARARRQAALEEDVRLALWRMESLAGPLVDQENRREYFVYTAFYPAEGAYTNMFAEIERGQVLLPSPLLTYRNPLVRLHFQVDPTGRVTSPQVPTGNMRDLAEARYTSAERIERAAERLAALGPRLEAGAPASALPLENPETLVPTVIPEAAIAAQKALPRFQAGRNVEEFQARGRQFQQLSEYNNELLNRSPAVPPGVRQGMMKGLWLGDALVLARRVAVGEEEYVQGVWLDWPAVRDWLEAEVRGLLPGAHLDPAVAEAPDAARRLAALPVRIVPDGRMAARGDGVSARSVMLAVAWAAVVLAIGAVAVLLAGIVSLSERRAAFVSAVTHEMRTPLTTFRMYAEMLREDMIPDADRRRRYLATLSKEAERLGHLVENVLAYARLERGAGGRRTEPVAVGRLIEGMTERLRGRADQADMELVVEVPEDVAAETVRADVAAAEQIVLNLVDNACKYAAEAQDRRIHLAAGRTDGRVALEVADHGPGVASDVGGRLFRPFSKSATEAAATAPGVGLGLALSRRLARAMGGRLRLAASDAGGARFVLELPRA